MKRATFVATLGVVLAMLVAVPAVGLAVTEADVSTQDEQNGTAPGEQLSGVVGVQEAELESDIDQRTFGIRIAQAASEEAQADVVADQLTSVDDRLANLEERKAQLDQQRADGEISEGKYKSEVTKLAAETEATKQLVNRTERTAGELPPDLLEDRGVDVEAIQTLKDRANELTGPEVAEIARGIAGDGVGQTPADQRPDHAPGPPGDGDERDERGNEDRSDEKG